VNIWPYYCAIIFTTFVCKIGCILVWSVEKISTESVRGPVMTGARNMWSSSATYYVTNRNPFPKPYS